ncbi:MAG: hypothetical protein ABSF15_24300 [Candidatus Sulfotelmatobacter sp.]|jgi:energy-coupling factor transporter ATP-binding protein EcfA2
MAHKDTLIEQATALIEDPRFIFRVGKKIGELGMVHEFRNRLIIFLACLTMFLRNKVSVSATAPSGSGKSTLMEIPLKVFPPECVVRRASFSRKALAFGQQSLDKKILYVNEYSGSSEARQMLRILQSEGELAHEYTVGGKTKVARRSGSPVVLTTTADEVISEDDATRCLTIRVSEAPDKILAVLKASLNSSKNDVEPEDAEPGLEVWQQAIRLIGERANNPFEFPSWLEFVAEQLPRDRVRVQRDWKRFLALLQAAALCRPQLRSTNEIAISDYCVAHRILGSAFTATAHAVNQNELAIQRAVKKLSGDERRPVAISDLRKHLNWADGAVYKYVRMAVKHRLVEFEPGTREKNVKRLLPTDAVVGDFLPDPKKVLEHIGIGKGKTTYINPLTGETVSL